MEQKNPAKVHAVQEVFIREHLSIVTVDASSGVSAQPRSDEETMQGALNRAEASLHTSGAELAIGLEGGVTETPSGWMLCNWGALVTENGQFWLASGAKIPLPNSITEPLLAGAELGEIIAELTKDKDSHKKDGAIGYLTARTVSRKEMFTHIVQLLYGQYRFEYQSFTH